MNGIWKYRHLLPDVSDAFRLSLGEGNTPLLKSRRLGRDLGLDNLYFKLEIVNPSGSYKDRFAAAAVSDLLQAGHSLCLATSSGNTGAALACYCSAADIRCFLAVVDGAPAGKLQQMQLYGAHTLMVKDFGFVPEISDQVFSGLRSLAAAHKTQVQISAYHYSPLGMAGVQTIAYEIAEQLPDENVHVFSPAGGGGLTLAVAKGFRIWSAANPGYRPPKVHCVQPSGNDTIAGPLREGQRIARAVAQSTTSVSGLQVPNIIDGDDVIAHCRESGGTGFAIEDELVYECQKAMALKEGIYCEPAGAVALAGAIRALREKKVRAGDPVVCLVTGHGFKDTSAYERMNDASRNGYFLSPAETFRFIEQKLTW